MLANWVIPNTLVDLNAHLFDKKLEEMMVKMKQKNVVSPNFFKNLLFELCQRNLMASNMITFM